MGATAFRRRRREAAAKAAATVPALSAPKAEWKAWAEAAGHDTKGLTLADLKALAPEDPQEGAQEDQVGGDTDQAASGQEAGAEGQPQGN